MSEAAPIYPRPRREATVLEARALAHPLRMRILRACRAEELTNKQLADRLEVQPGTVFYHVKLLLGAGLIEQVPVRTGVSGALEKPYRSTGASWWLNNPLRDTDPEIRFGPIETFQDELRRAGPDSVQDYASFVLHLAPEDVEELDRRILAVLDEYIDTDQDRRHLPAHAGLFLVHRLAPDGQADEQLDGEGSPARDAAEG